MNEIEFDIVLSILDGIIAFASMLLAVAAFIFTVETRRTLSRAEQVSNIEALFFKAYLFREFTQPVLIDGLKVVSIREARLFVNRALVPVDNETEEEARNRFVKNTLEPGNWENVFAYEVSIGLNTIGSAILSGAVPLTFVLASCGLLVVDDWLLCRGLVEKIRRARPAPLENLPDKTSIHRIHGEWLAYAAAAWLVKSCSGVVLERFAEVVGGKEAMLKRERQLRRTLYVVTPETERQIELALRQRVT